MIRRISISTLLEKWKTVKHESDSSANCNGCFWYSHQMIIKGAGGLENKRMSGDNPNCSIDEITQNTEKCLGGLRRLAVTQTPVEDH